MSTKDYKRERRKKNVCPKCGARGCVRIPNKKYKGASWFRPYRCPTCGEVTAFCDLKCNTPEESEEARQKKLAYKRAWYQEHREHALKVQKEYAIANAERIRAYDQKRRGKGGDDHEKHMKRCADYQKAHPEKRKEISHRYYENHKDTIIYKQKLYLLKKAREEK